MLFSLDIEKRLGSEFWTNRYLIRHTSLALAQVFATALASFEQSLHHPSVSLTRYRVSDTDLASDAYIIVPLNYAGTRTVGGTLLPLFNTLRMDISATSGRPSRKYYRGVLTENDIAGDAVTENFTSFATALENYTPDPAGSNGLVDPQQQDLVDVTVHPYVQMRQLRRSKRRRTNGGGIFQ